METAPERSSEEVTFEGRLDNKKPAWEGVCVWGALLRAEGTAGAKMYWWEPRRVWRSPGPVWLQQGDCG